MPYPANSDYDPWWAVFEHVDPNDEVAMKSIFRGWYAKEWNGGEFWNKPPTAEAVQAALTEMVRLAQGDPAEAEYVYNGMLMGPEPPYGDYRLYFRWVHDELLFAAEKHGMC